MLGTTRPKTGLARTVIVSAVGLLPVGIVSGMMLMQIFRLSGRIDTVQIAPFDREVTMLKRVLSAALALSLLSGSVAFADPYGNRGSYSDRGNHRDRGDYHDRGDNRGNWGDHRWVGRRHRDDGTALAVGVGIFALLAIAASQNGERDRDAQYRRAPDGDYRDGPPPQSDYGSGYGPPPGR